MHIHCDTCDNEKFEIPWTFKTVRCESCDRVYGPGTEQYEHIMKTLREDGAHIIRGYN